MDVLAATAPAAMAWRKAHKRPPLPVAPYDDKPEIAARCAIDRKNGEPIPIDWLQTYAEAIAQYHLHDEAKFHGGQKKGKGVLQRRHINVLSVRHVGKEGHNWEEDYFVGTEGDSAIDYERGVIELDNVLADIRRGRDVHGVRALTHAAGMSDKTLKDICDGKPIKNKSAIVKARRAVYYLDQELAVQKEQDASALDLRQMVSDSSMTAVASKFGIDPANLRKTLKGERQIPDTLHTRFFD